MTLGSPDSTSPGAGCSASSCRPVRARSGRRAPNERPVRFYEMETAGLVRKSSRGQSRRGSGDDPREQEVTDALIWLRDKGLVPWTWIADETRQLQSGNTPRRSPSLSGPPSTSLGSIRGPVSRR
jgi:hypothetical protein